MKHTLTAIAAAALITLTGCGTGETEAQPDPATSQEELTPNKLFNNDINSVALMYRWVPAEGEDSNEPMPGRYTFDVSEPGNEDGPSDSFMSIATPGVDPEFPSESVFDFYVDYVPVPDGRRVWTAAHNNADNFPEGAGIECLIVSLDGQGILAHEVSHDLIKGAVCEYEF